MDFFDALLLVALVNGWHGGAFMLFFWLIFPDRHVA